MDEALLSHIPKDCRGVIVVDANILFLLNTAISNSRLDQEVRDKPKKYLDILKFLAKKGYYIIIPEMVAFETGGITLAEKNVDDYFPANPGITKREDLLKSNTHFLGEILKNRHENMAVWPLPENNYSEPALWLRNINTFMRDNFPSLGSTNGMVRLQNARKSHWGEIAGIETLKDILDLFIN